MYISLWTYSFRHIETLTLRYEKKKKRNKMESRAGFSRNSGKREGGRREDEPKKEREAIINLGEYVDKKIRVRFTGGREVSGF